MRKKVAILLSSLGLLLPAGLAGAHTPYLKPNLFTTPQRDHVTVEASFAEDFFVPDVVMKADDYHVVTPSGARLKLASVTYLRDLALFEVDLPDPGTYRISTGQRTGSTRRMALVNGKWEALREGEVPAGVRVAEAQSITRADLYVSKGPVSEKALAPTGVGLEIVPMAHPNRLDAGGALAVRLLFEGKPLAGAAISLHGEGPEEGGAKPVTLTTDAEGKASFSLPRDGTFLLLSRHRVEVPDGPVAVKSHSATLTFAVGA